MNPSLPYLTESGRPDATGSESRGGLTAHERAPDAKEEWLTPPEIIRALGDFDLDPCAPVQRPWEMARRHFTWKDNGLRLRWEGRVWMNPPYGMETSKWMGRLAEHGNGIALIFARTETSTWFQHIWGRASAVLFLKGRLSFYNVDGTPGKNSAGGPSALIAYGQENAAILRACPFCGRPGAMIQLGDGIGATFNAYCTGSEDMENADCGVVQYGLSGQTQEHVAALWNRRAPEPVIVDFLRKFRDYQPDNKKSTRALRIAWSKISHLAR